MTAPVQPARYRRVFDYARFEAIGFLRNGEQVLVALVLPAMALLGLGVAQVVEVSWRDLPRIDVVTPGVLALAIVSTSFTSVAISTAFDRRWGVLRQLATTPLGSGGIVAGKVVAVFAIQLLQIAVLSLLGLALGWRPEPAGLLWALPVWVIGSLCFTGLGLALASRLRAEAVLAVANLLWVVLALGGLVTPIEVGGILTWLRWLPGCVLGDAMREAMALGAFPWVLVVALSGWAAASLAVAARLFRPSE